LFKKISSIVKVTAEMGALKAAAIPAAAPTGSIRFRFCYESAKILPSALAIKVRAKTRCDSFGTKRIKNRRISSFNARQRGLNDRQYAFLFLLNRPPKIETVFIFYQ